MAKKSTGLEPRNFTWVIKGKLAVSERIGGYGFQHRKVRREEELIWLEEAGITTIVSLYGPEQSILPYEAAGFRSSATDVPVDIEPEDVEDVLAVIAEAIDEEDSVVLIHRDTVDDTLAGLLASYLLYSGKLEDPIVATDVIQRILGFAIGPEGRRLIATA